MNQININSDFPIFKFGNRTFIIDNTLIKNKILINLLNLLDNGFNFITCFHLNTQTAIIKLIKDFDNNFIKLNKSLFYDLMNNKNINKRDKESIITLSVPKCKEIDCILKQLNKINSKKKMNILKESHP